MRTLDRIATVYGVENGWVVLTDHESGAYGYPPDAPDGAVVIAEMKAAALRMVADAMGIGSRYDAGRVRIVVEPGDKHGD